jgi:hypothetical protein
MTTQGYMAAKTNNISNSEHIFQTSTPLERIAATQTPRLRLPAREAEQLPPLNA